MIIATRRAVLGAAVVLSACGAPSTAADEQAIAALMRAAWDRPEASLETGPIAVLGANAVADWTQGPRGGRALLFKRDGRWSVILCGGEPLRTAEGLSEAGVPLRTARGLAALLAEKERAVSSGRLAVIASFVGIVRME
ncbi:MAG: copper uptake system-associated protein [Hyphomonadaceae bacterium]|nr:copper uptake system-associated protein [Hyphomonadaceae bacterium]